MAEQGILEGTTRQLGLYINTATVTISVLQFSSLSRLFTKKLFFKLTLEFAETQRMAHWIWTGFKSVYKIEEHRHCAHFLQSFHIVSFVPFCSKLYSLCSYRLLLALILERCKVSLRVLRMQAEAETVFSRHPAKQPMCKEAFKHFTFILWQWGMTSGERRYKNFNTWEAENEEKKEKD